MSIENHSLVNEFPEFKDKIHELKQDDRHFHRLFNDYHDIDKEVHRIENGAENTSDDYLESCKIKRLNLKDDLFKILNATPA